MAFLAARAEVSNAAVPNVPAARCSDAARGGVGSGVDARPTNTVPLSGSEDAAGCPDDPVKVTVLVTLQGSPAPGASLSVVTGHGTTTYVTDRGQPLTIEATPGDQWELTASRPPCYAGRNLATIVEGPQTLTVPLTPAPSTRVLLTVLDKQGVLVPGVRIRWNGSDPACLPAPAFLEGGTGTQLVGVGAATILAALQDGSSTSGSVDVPPSGDFPVRLVLAEHRRVTTSMVDCNIGLDRPVYFGPSSDIIPAEFYAVLTDAAAVINEHRSVGQIEVGGYASGEGAASLALELSSRRAHAVVDFLVSRGVPSERLTAVGFGETPPVASNNTEAGREQNRRVAFALLDKRCVRTTDRAGPPAAPPE